MITPFTNNRPGVDWFRSFLKRNQLKLKKVEQLECSRRANTSNPFLIYGFYDLLEETMRKLDIFDKPNHIYNVDESGFLYDPKRQEGVVHQSTSAHRTIMGSGKETTTVCACVSALGKYLPPLIIFEGKSFWSSWVPDGDETALYAYADNGFMTCDIFYAYIQKLANLIVERPLLLLLDGHLSHLDTRTLEFALQEGITILKLPSHTTDVLQPLDKACFYALKTDWDNTQTEFQMKNHRKMTKLEFVSEIVALFDRTNSQHAVKGFRSAGIYPFNRGKYPVKRLNPIKLAKYNEQKRLQLQIADTAVADDSIHTPGTSYGGPHTSTPCATVNNSFSSSSGDSSNPSIGNQSTFSFEEALLAKIGRTEAPRPNRRKIDCSARVVTSIEFLEEVRNKNAVAEAKKNKPKQRGRKRKAQVNYCNLLKSISFFFRVFFTTLHIFTGLR